MTLEKLAAAREHRDFSTINQLQKDLAFHVSRHVLQNVRADWVAAFWRMVNWEDVAQRFQKVRSLDLGL